MAPQDDADEKKERRRAQNVAAQRTYRAKQKERIRRLERLTVEAIARSGSDHVSMGNNSAHQAEFADLQGPYGQQHFGALATQKDEAVWPTGAGSLTATAIGRYVNGFSMKEKQTFHLVVMREHFTIRDIVKYGLIHIGLAMKPALAEAARHASTTAWLTSVRNDLGDVDIVTVVAAGIKLLANLSVPADQLSTTTRDTMQRMLSLATPQPWTPLVPGTAPPLPRSLTLRPEAYSTAVFANAAMLHIDFDELTVQDLEYPSPPCPDAKSDLIPTPSQMVVPHHRAFDTLPWPVFRENLCQALACDPPLVDDEELCLDLLNDGVVCWGSVAGSLHGRGMGAPWDSRSWEAAPWFLEKYEMLTGGRDGDMWRNSEWWRAIRN